MTSVSRSIALNLGVFAADNGVRRNVASLSTSYVTEDANLNVSYHTLNPSDTFTLTPAEASSVMVVYVSGPTRADVSYAQVTAGSYVRPAGGNIFIVNQVMVVDDAVTEVVLTNNQSYAIRLTLVQG